MQLNRYQIIFLGAGFSVPAGLPLANELWKKIREEADDFSDSQRAGKFIRDLEDYVTFRLEAYGEKITVDDVDFEDFMQFLDVEHFLGLRGSDTWGPEGNEGTVITKYLIGKVLADHCNAIGQLPKIYLDFAKRLQPGDTIISFNYDTLVERALEEIGKPYRLYPYRFQSVGKSSNVVDSSYDDEIVLLKMHGSIDWFDRSFSLNSKELRDSLGLGIPHYSIFSKAQEYGLEKIVVGPRADNDPTDNLFRAKNLRAIYADGPLYFEPPKLLTPSVTKLLYSNTMHDFWNGMSKAGHLNFGMSIVGFSLPLHDNYLRQILYRVVTNYQSSYWENGQLGRKKTPLVLVDFFRDPEAEARYKEKYKFVNWKRARLVGNGFNEYALDQIFSVE